MAENPGDSFLIARERSEVESKVRGSRFVARAFPINSREEAEELIAGLRKREHDATHHCFAYILRDAGRGGGDSFRYSDGGEPSGSAGRPIYDRLCGAGLTDTLVIVTRYFGGTKLGVGGLVRAYGAAAALALEKSGAAERFEYVKFTMTLGFPLYQRLKALILRLEGVMNQTEFGEVVQLNVSIRRSLADEFERSFTELTGGKNSLNRI
ncbi:MAG: IMPACT family protein [Candidatus Zixiibacteriota bacterium]